MTLYFTTLRHSILLFNIKQVVKGGQQTNIGAGLQVGHAASRGVLGGVAQLCMTRLAHGLKLPWNGEPMEDCRHDDSICKFSHEWRKLGKAQVLKAVKETKVSWLNGDIGTAVKTRLIKKINEEKF